MTITELNEMDLDYEEIKELIENNITINSIIGVCWIIYKQTIATAIWTGNLEYSINRYIESGYMEKLPLEEKLYLKNAIYNFFHKLNDL